MLMKDLPAESYFMVGHLAARQADRSLRKLSQPMGKFTEVIMATQKVHGS